MELALLDILKLMDNVVTTLVPSFFIGSSSFGQVTRSTINIDGFKIGPDQTCDCGVSCPLAS